MKVLFVTGECPYPPNNGSRLRTSNLLSHLSLRHQITLVSVCMPGTDLDAVFRGYLQRVIPVPPVPQTIWRRLSSLASPLPYVVSRYASPGMRTAVQDVLATDHFDLLHCDSVFVVPAIPCDTPVPKVYNAHNIEAVIWERYLSVERRPWMVPILRSQLAKAAAYESMLPRLFDCCVTVSEQNRQLLMLRYGYDLECTSVAVNGVDLDYYTPIPDPLTPTVAFIGSLDYYPNEDAFRWFLTSIWPQIKVQAPEATMSLIGCRPPAWIADSCRRSGITLYADVPDTRPHLATAAVIVVPLRIGGGTRLKILEAMAAGRCVVATTIGAEGLDVLAGKHLVIADEPADFAQQVVSLLRDRARREAFAAAGRELVEAGYGWDQAALQMEEAWGKALIAHRHIDATSSA